MFSVRYELTLLPYIQYICFGRCTAFRIAARCGLDGPAIECLWGAGGENFRIRPDRPWGPPSFLYNGYRVIPGGKAAGAWR